MSRHAIGCGVNRGIGCSYGAPKLEGPAGGARGEADARERDAGTPQSTGALSQPHTCHDMNPPFPGPCAACAKEQHESKVDQSLEHVLYLLDELYTLVNGECPSLLDEDRGGDASLDAKIARALLLKGIR